MLRCLGASIFICFAVGACVFVGGYYPAYSVLTGKTYHSDDCNYSSGCYFAGNSGWNCNGYLISSFGLGSYNYIYNGPSIPSTVPCYVNRCSPVFSQYDFYMPDCTYVQNTFYFLFTDYELNTSKFVITGSVFFGLGLLLTVIFWLVANKK
ncbi:MAG: hypothetical protein Terrestrivirus8_44 [Terrestrivirus sp.]|uniref:Uncharacterized protein n=1 Tax=Terrestrivirus sp. TaxID=2487775 RepID=A0A3G4ZRD6_9VIRU|nr:MAG: hypothetical protein Terrestrivirus8_44 [Terrestrivirus sp.]